MYVCMCVHDYIYIYVTCILRIVLFTATSTADPSGNSEVITFEQWRTRLHTLLDRALSQSSSSTSGSVRTPRLAPSSTGLQDCF